MTSSLAYEQLPPQSGGKPKNLVMLLHGLGSNAQDLIGLAPMWAPVLPDTQFVSPDAPFPCDMAPFGYQWFSLQDRNPDIMEKGAAEAAPLLHRFIDEQLARHDLPISRLALVGFSQGTMMSLYVGLRRPEPVAGILGYSGALLGGEELTQVVQSRPPVCLVHGEQDPVVPFAAMGYAEAALKSLQVPVSSFARPWLEHSIDQEGLGIGAGFLQKILQENQPAKTA